MYNINEVIVTSSLQVAMDTCKGSQQFPVTVTLCLAALCVTASCFASSYIHTGAFTFVILMITCPILLFAKALFARAVYFMMLQSEVSA